MGLDETYIEYAYISALSSLTPLGLSYLVQVYLTTLKSLPLFSFSLSLHFVSVLTTSPVVDISCTLESCSHRLHLPCYAALRVRTEADLRGFAPGSWWLLSHFSSLVFPYSGIARSTSSAFLMYGL